MPSFRFEIRFVSTAILGDSGGCQAVVVFIQPGMGQPEKKKQPGSGPKDLTKENIVQISKASYNAFVSLDSFESFFRGAFSMLFYRSTLPKSTLYRSHRFPKMPQCHLLLSRTFFSEHLLMPLFAMQEQPFFVLLYLVCLNLLLSFELRGST